MIGEFLLVTTFWNESRNMKGLVSHIAQQGLTPKCWLLIDDGSMDDSAEIAVKECEHHGIPYLLFSMPTKVKGSFETIGHAFTEALNNYLDEINNLGIEFIVKLDADTRLSPDYLEIMTFMMKRYPRIGTISGQIRGEDPREKGPMGTAKAVRWSIAKRIQEYWRGDPDTFWNLKSIQYGYWLVTIDDLLVDTTRPSQGFTRSGAQLLGRQYAYSRRHTLIVLYIGMKMMMNRTFGIDFIAAFLKEKLSGQEVYTDEFIQLYNSLTFHLLRVVYRSSFLKKTSTSKINRIRMKK